MCVVNMALGLFVVYKMGHVLFLIPHVESMLSLLGAWAFDPVCDYYLEYEMGHYRYHRS